METKQESRPRNTLLIVLACGGLLVGLLGLAGGGVALYFVVKRNHELEIQQKVETERITIEKATADKLALDETARLTKIEEEKAKAARRAIVEAEDKAMAERLEAERKQHLEPNMVAFHKLFAAMNGDDIMFVSIKAKIDAIDQTGVSADLHYTMNKTARWCELMIYFGAAQRKKEMTFDDCANLVLNDVSKILKDKENAVANLAEFINICSTLDKDTKEVVDKYYNAYVNSNVWKYIKD